MWVYKANNLGYPGGIGSTGFASLRDQLHQVPRGFPPPRSFDIANPTGSGWPYQTQLACDVANWDSVGVFIKLNHKYMTNLFGTSITLTDHAVFRLEPAPTEACG